MKKKVFMGIIFAVIFVSLSIVCFSGINTVVGYGKGTIVNGDIEGARRDAIYNAQQNILNESVKLMLKSNINLSPDVYLKNTALIKRSEKISVDQKILSLAIQSDIDFYELYLNIWDIPDYTGKLLQPKMLVCVENIINGRFANSFDTSDSFMSYIEDDLHVFGPSVYKNVVYRVAPNLERYKKILSLAKLKKIDFVIFGTLITSSTNGDIYGRYDSNSLMKFQCVYTKTGKIIYETNPEIEIKVTDFDTEKAALTQSSDDVVLSFFEDYKYRFMDIVIDQWLDDLYYVKVIKK